MVPPSTKCRAHRHQTRTTTKEGWWQIEGPAEQLEPGRAEFGLKGEFPCSPFRRAPQKSENDGADDDHLAPEDFCCGHGIEKSGRPAVQRKPQIPLGVAWKIVAK